MDEDLTDSERGFYAGIETLDELLGVLTQIQEQAGSPVTVNDADTGLSVNVSYDEDRETVRL